MQIHFKKFEPERDYTLMVYDSDLDDFIEKSIPDAAEQLKDEIFGLCANLLNELGIYMTGSEDENE